MKRFILVTSLLVSCVGVQSTETPTLSPDTGEVVEPGQCPEAALENRSDERINADDRANMETAKKHCVNFYPRSPCLITFIKRAPLVYWAICGGKR